MELSLIRWRDADPGESDRSARGNNWTRVHVLAANGTSTICGLVVPNHPYMEDYNADIPAGAPKCQRCARKVEMAVAP